MIGLCQEGSVGPAHTVGGEQARRIRSKFFNGVIDENRRCVEEFWILHLGNGKFYCGPKANCRQIVSSKSISVCGGTEIHREPFCVPLSK